MTILEASQVRGFFDPVALGLNVPAKPEELQQYLDELSVRDSATLIHEITHYLQFYGTAFGYYYLLSVRGMSVAMLEAMSSTAADTSLRYPASSWPLELGSIYNPQP